MSLKPNPDIKASFAVSVSLDLLMVAITASMLSNAIIYPSKI
jgi:hypothetical protein